MLMRILAVLRVFQFIWSHPLNAGARFRAVFAFLRWQVCVRCAGTKVVVPWVDDSRLLVGRGESGLTGNIYCGFMEFEEMAFVLHVLRVPDVFIDVGANVGAYTVLAANVVGSNVIAFEPVPSTYQRLLDQVYLNRIGSLVDVKNCGVSDRPGVLRFTTKLDTVNRVSVTSSSEDTIEVEVVALDSVVPEGKLCLLKVDVEGFEAAVLNGARRLLASGNVLAMVVEMTGAGSEYGYSDAAVHETLTELGYFPVSYDPFNRRVSRRDQFGGGGGNTIYVRDLEGVAGRCQEASRRIVRTARNVAI